MSFLLTALWLTLYGVRVVRWGRDLARPSTPLAPVARDLTVVIPCRNEAAHLGDLLDDLRGLDVLVIDDGSDDGTAALARQRGARVLPNPGTGKKSALRAGFQAATTPWVATLDADVRIGPDWATALLGAASDDIDAVIAPVRLAPHPDAPWSRVQALEYACMMGWALSTARRGQAQNGSSANLLWRRTRWLELDLREDEASGDDLFALEALAAEGGRTAAATGPAAWATTNPVSSWRGWIHQRARWGKKSRKYRSAGARTVSALVAGYVLFLIGLPLPAAAALFLGKTLLDAWYAHHAARAFDLPWHPVADDLRLALGYPVLVMAAAVQMLRPMEWKGRRI